MLNSVRTSPSGGAAWQVPGVTAGNAPGREGTPMNSNFRNLAIWVVIGLLLMALFNLFQNPGTSRRGNEIPYSEFLAAVDAGNVSEVTIQKHRIQGSYRDKSNTFTT